MVEVPSVTKRLSKEDLKLLCDVKKAATKTCDAVVKRDKDGKYCVYENKITKIS